MLDYVDVVVVGAGLSGLHAACSVHAAGFSLLVLEAKDRVGGKTWSRPTITGGMVDLGAAWINDTNQSKMFALSQRFNLETIVQRAEGNDLHQLPDGSMKIVPFGASRVHAPVVFHSFSLSHRPAHSCPVSHVISSRQMRRREGLQRFLNWCVQVS
jgi:monoamine oxidase